MEPVIINLGKVCPTAEGVWKDKYYDKLCIVNNPAGTKTYISKKEVPRGTALNNEEFWQPVASGSGSGVDNITIGENGNWFINGVDTGIKAQGPMGPAGPQGPTGPMGPEGPAGDTPLATKTVFIFKASETQPDKPVGGYWDYDSNTVTYPDGWNPTQDNMQGMVWMSIGTFIQTGELIDGWSEPIQITGDKGENGQDGISIEFIYKLTKNNLDVPSKPDSINQDDYVPDGWSDSPKGISIDNKVEWVCTRRKINNIWEDWKEPVIWSKWGDNGMDGDGVEYIYKTTTIATPPERPTDVSQEDDFIPSGWNDNPTGVTSSIPYEWVSVRKSKNGVWGKFSIPALWAKYGEDGTNGISIRTMYTKTANSSVVPDVIVNNINPGSVWGIGFPTYSGNEAVWGIQAQVTYDNKLATNWQGPYLITGVNGKDAIPPNYKVYVYKLSSSKPNKPTGNDPSSPGNGWIDYPNTAGQWWQCIGSVNGVTELVTKWSEVLPVNGKDGIAQDGKFTEFRFAKSTNDSAPAINKTLREPGNNWFKEPPQINTGNNESLWITSALINPDDTLSSNWSDPVRISGERGPQGETGPVGPAGPTGSQGVSGIPGVSYVNLYFGCNVDKSNNIDFTNEYTKIIKALYDAYKTQANISSKGTLDDPVATNIIGASKVARIKQEIQSYKNIIDAGTAEPDEILEAKKQYALKTFLYYKGLQFVPNINDLYYNTYEGGDEDVKGKYFPYIAFIQARVVADVDDSYSFDANTTEWSEPQLLQGINGINGTNGTNGTNGVDGVGIKSIVDYYKLTVDNIPPEITKSDSTTVLTPDKSNPYLWVNELITYTNNGEKWSGVRLLLKHVEDAISIDRTLTTYGVSKSISSKPSSWQTIIPLTQDDEYLWTRIQIFYTNDTSSESFTVVKNGINPNSIERIDEEYGLSTDDKTPPTQWDINPVVPTNDKKYAWNRETIVYTDGTKQVKEPHIYALYLSDGVQGKPGETIDDIINYYAFSKSSTAPKKDVSNDDNILHKQWYDNVDLPNNTTVEEMLNIYPNKEYPYIYNYEKIVLSSGTIYTSPIRQIAKYIESGRGTVNLYAVGHDKVDWNTITFAYLIIYPYYKNNPNINTITWDYIKSQSAETKQAICDATNTYFNITEEDNKLTVVKLEGILTVYAPYMDIFNNDLIFTAPDGDVRGAPDYPIFMIKADVIVQPDGTYKFAEGTTQWSEPVLINGQKGNSINSVIVRYGLGSSNSSYSDVTFDQTKPPTPTDEKPYIWQKTTYRNNKDEEVSSTYNLYQVGKDGISVNEIVEYYCISASDKTAPTEGWTTTVQTMTSVNRYLWNYEVFQMSDGSTKETAKRVIGVYGRDGEAVGGIGIKSIDEYYQRWISDTVAPNFELGEDGTPTNSSWITTFPTDLSSLFKFVWNVQVITYTDNTKYISPATCIYRQTADGTDGTNGADGVGIKSITDYYLLTNQTTGITISSSGWSTVVKTPTQSQRYVWNYEKIVYTDDSVYTSPPHIIAGMGENGQDGEQGKKGQLVYPAGIYGNTTSYTTDDNKAPYVLDSSDGNFYVLNAKMTWIGTSQGNRTPAQDYATNKGKYWLKFDAFEAIYAKIGIIANGLIGAAVFNGDWMFSQYGINYYGSQTTAYEKFNPSWLTLTKFTTSVTFVPKYAVNLKTGVTYIHGTGSSSNIPSLTIDNGAITFVKKSYSTTTNYTTKIINGNTVYHANGSKIFSTTSSNANVDVYGICTGNSPSALVKINDNSSYYKLHPANGIIKTSDGFLTTDSGEAIISINGVLYILGYASTISSFNSWLSSIN